MMCKTINIILFVGIFNRVVHCNYLNYSQPQIYVSNGDLVFKAADDKNLALMTSKSGKLFLNGQDLTTVLKDIGGVSDTLEQYKSNDGLIATMTNGLSFLSDRVDQLEAGNRTSIIGPLRPINTRMFGRLNRRLLALQRKVQNLINLLMKNECVSNPCANGGICQDVYNGFLCDCTNNWEGPTCERDVNECTHFANTGLGCLNGATCVNKPGSFECICASGWLGIHCNRKTAECTGTGNDLCGHGKCISQSTTVGYTCICDQGWTVDANGIACTKDVNECVSNKPPCSTNPVVDCINLPGTFYCGFCPPGFTGNGYYCTDIDECAIFNGGCSVNPQVQCINTQGSRMCGLCPPGYQGNGMTCTYQGSVCATNNGGCSAIAQCRDNQRISSTYVECICPSGYRGTGIGPNGCQLTTVLPSTSPCLSNPCMHGTCAMNNVTGGYVCNCYRRYSGTQCEIAKNPCDSSPCQNGGTCVTFLRVFYRCRCTSSFTGALCQTETQACGGSLYGESGELTYPATNTSITLRTVRQSCAWIIHTNSSKILTIKFKMFKLTDNCVQNFLQIHDGRNSAAHMLGRFCTSEPPMHGVINSTTNLMYLWYRTDIVRTGHGFSITWDTIDPVCGGNIPALTHGTIRSPGSPGNYPNNRDCYWKLTAPMGKRLEFHFFSLMIGNNVNCTSDYLEFYQGLSSTDPMFAQFCNSSHPEPLVSPGHEVTMHFHSDSADSYPGFQITYSVIGGIPGCGGIYTNNEGEIISPSISGTYPPNSICEFKIQLANSVKVRITFLSFSLGDSQDCQFDYVSIHEGASIDSPLVGKYCGGHIPSPVTAVGNQLLIALKTDWSTGGKGFKLRYEVVCGGKFSAPNGLIHFPSAHYQSAMERKECIYEIMEKPGTIITLNILELSIADNSGFCLNGYLEVRDGDNDNSTLIGNYCDKVPTQIRSTQNYLWLKFLVTMGSSFKANYSISDIGCGGILKTKHGTIQSPEHLESYKSSINCTWIIIAPPEYIIQLTWITFNVEESTQCSYDRVMIYDNNSASGMGGLMGEFCGVKLPPTLLSSSNMLTVKFVTDNTVMLDGFLATYVFIKETNVCGGNYYTSAGMISSPNFPNEYPPNKQCSWVITVKPGQQIMLNITSFNIESYTNCRYDYLEIKNGGTASAPLIGKYCGTTIPAIIPSHSNKLFIHFQSDMTKTEQGFQILWQSSTTGCGGTLTSPTGSIISPHYPEPYSRNTECFWKISTSAGSVLQIIFADIDLEPHVTCFLDHVELFDGFDVTSKSLGRFCSAANPTVIKSTLNHMTVKFRSDVSYQGRGFNMQYSTVCHNKVSGFRGVIESPNFPHGYPQDQDCLWEIGVPEGNSINITFSHFEIEKTHENPNNKSCIFDYVEIKYMDAESSEMVTYGTYCGGQEPPPVISIKANMTQVKFITDNLLVGAGFRLEWVIDGCGGLYTHPNGTIQTPNYPLAYPKSTTCNWIIQSAYGTSVQITFHELDFEKNTYCSYDYIMIFNGPDDTYPLISQFCHFPKAPITLTSTGNNMYIRFACDSSFEGHGFYANYTTVPTKCGGKLSAPSGTITSPNYPKNFDQNDTCGWLIEVAENHKVELLFTDLDIMKSPNCQSYYVKVYNGPSKAYPVLAKLCGNTTPNETFVSTYNHMYVEMVSHFLITSKGFSAKYDTACGARIETQSSGLLEFTQMYSTKNEENCTWTLIAARPDEHISLTLTHMNLQSCDYGAFSPSALVIYNGDDENAPKIGEYCGTKVPPMITSTGSALHIAMTNIYNSIFTASYSVYDSACGGSLESTDGEFGSPGYPEVYPVNIQCEWFIKVSAGNRVTLSFSTFDIVESENCNDDYLEVRVGSNIGQLLGIFCGSNVPSTIKANDTLWLLFSSSKPEVGEDAKTAKGFLAEFTLVHGNELYGQTGQISSPLYPRPFRFTGSYTWRITVKRGFAVLLSFEDMYVEVFDSVGCYLSSMQIFDGYDSTSPELKTICGFTLPDNIQSTSNVMFILLDMGIEREGSKFLANWTAVPVMKTLPGKPKPQISGCGSDEVINMYELKNYTISSPGFPVGYGPNLNCEWKLKTEPRNHLSIIFYTVDVEHHSGCLMDTIKVFSKVDSGWNSLATVCYPNATRTEIQGSDSMKVVFETDSHVNETGFTAMVFHNCGGSLSGPSGIIPFQNETYYENNVEPYTVCNWNITVRSGRTIKIEFLSFDLGPNTDNTCSNYILLKNGLYADSPILGNGKYCGSNKPEVLQTTGNHIYIKAKKFTKVEGFVLKYTEVSSTCGGDLVLTHEERSVMISSPNYPNIPIPHTECKWTVHAPPGESIQIDYEERFDLAEEVDCDMEAVEIRDGGTDLSPLLGRHCGTEIPSSVVSTDNMIFIKFFTNIDDPKNGFKAKLEIATCGGVVRSNVGLLQSPHFNEKKSYSKMMNCTWRIIGPRDHFMKLQFKTIDMLQSLGNCTQDFVAVTELMTINNTRIVNDLGKYCRKQIPGEITTSTNEVIVQFLSKSKSPLYRGFSLAYNSSQEACGGTMETRTGIITSPGYPIINHNRRNCEWTIRVPKGRRIRVEIEDFDLDESLGFYEQGMAFFNGEEYRSTLMRAGDKRTVIRSSDNILKLFFWSTHSSSHRGFKASYSSDEPSACIGDFNQTEGVITQPTENLTTYSCSWVHARTTYHNETVAMQVVIKMNASYHSRYNCKLSANSLLILDRNSNNLAQFCGLDKTATVRSPLPYTKIMAAISNSAEFHGFNVTYKTYACGGVIGDSEGTIHSPGFPKPAGKTMECAWLIKLSDDQAAIKLTFDTFSLDQDCELSYFIIYNGDSPLSPKIGKYCSGNMPVNLQSQNNHVWLEYHVDVKSVATGFSLQYEPLISGCGGIYYDNSMIIQSPTYPKDYPNNAECVWEIHASNGYHIGLQFYDRFHLEKSDDCRSDYVEIWDYQDDNNWLSLGRVCGRDYPKIFNSTSNKMKIMFRSNDRVTGSGFKAKWTLNCGGTFTASDKVQYISSPGYPQGYPNDIQCIYVIKPFRRQSMLIAFDDFMLEKSSGSCRYDILSISKPVNFGRVTYLGTKRTFCGVVAPPPIKTNTDLKINFTTDSWITRRGFQLSYQIDSCGYDITTPSVISTIKTKPRTDYFLYSADNNCVWNITAPIDRIVIARFQILELYAFGNCTHTYVDVYNGFEPVEGNRLARMCGNLTDNLPIIHSTGNTMSIQSKSTSFSELQKGLKAYIYFMPGPAQNCGGTYNLSKGQTQTLRVPRLTEPLDCAWQITAPEDHTIKLEFVRKKGHVCDDHNSTVLNNCSCIVYQVRDGTGPLSELISRFCDDTERDVYVTSGRNAWFSMYSNVVYAYGPATEPPFELRITTVASKCGPSILLVTNETHYLTSPNYPNSYPDNIKCTYILKDGSDSNSKIYLNFVEFDLNDAEIDNDLATNSCKNDRIDVTDTRNTPVISEGLGPTSVFTGKSLHSLNPRTFPITPIGTHQFCGKSSVEHHYYSGGNKLSLSFFSGENRAHGKGFKMQYTLANCRQNYTSAQGRFLMEKAYQDCFFTISAPENYTISLYFQSFLFYDYRNCEEVGFEVKDLNATTPLARICGYRIPDPIFSNTNKISVRAWNRKTQSIGIYDVIYTTTDKGRGCGGQLYNYAGSFTSPLYPDIYRDTRTCVWEITTPAGLQVALKFSEFDIESSCSTDFLTVITYDSGTSNSHKFCKNDIPAVLYSNSRITVKHTTSSNNAGSGFVAHFMTITSDTNLSSW